MRILGPHPRPSESEILGWNLGVCVLKGTVGYSNAGPSLRPSTSKSRRQRPSAWNRNPEMTAVRSASCRAVALPFPGVGAIPSFSKGTQSSQDLIGYNASGGCTLGQEPFSTLRLSSRNSSG